MMRRRLRVALLLGLTAGCLDRDPAPINPCTQSGVVRNLRIDPVDKVDLLFMVDNSSSMDEEQASLAEQFPRLVRLLASGDRDDDGVEDFPPVSDLQIGVISSDMGTEDRGPEGCRSRSGGVDRGDDGVLQTEGNTSIPGCAATYPRFLRFQPAPGASADEFARDVSCVALDLQTRGCGFEQQLEATLKAITPDTCNEPYCLFSGGTRGHGGPGGLNTIGIDPFVRPDSVLALVLVTDEDDCSAADPDLFNLSSSVYSEPSPNLRCFRFKDHPNQPVHPIERYVDGFLATRSNPDLLVYAAITGVPTDLTVPAADGLPEVSFQQILDAPEMQEMVNDVPAPRTGLVPSCVNADPTRGFGDPPRRIVQVAEALEQRGANAVVQSICQADFTPALDAIIEKIAAVLDSVCLPRDLNPDAFGFVECEVIETLPIAGDFSQCSAIPGRERIEVTSDGNEVCRVDQVSPTGGEAGWFYDTAERNSEVAATCGADGQRISFSSGDAPRPGTLVRLECRQPVSSSAGPSFADVDSPCTAFGERCEEDAPAPGTGGQVCARSLVCDEATRTFQIPCTDDSTCPIGTRCDAARTEGTGPICRNPTCD